MKKVKLLGEYLRERTNLTDRQVVDGLRQQIIARDLGTRKRLGEILVERGYVTPKQVDEAAALQRADARPNREPAGRFVLGNQT